MKALSKDQVKERLTLVAAIRDAYAELEGAVDGCNATIEAERQKVEARQEALNARLQEAREWASGLVEAMRDYCDERSEKWREGEAGQAYEEWKAAYEGFDPEEMDVDLPGELELPECEVAEELDSLPEAP